MATKTTSSKAPRIAKPKRGNLSPKEIKPLVMAANKAFKIQEHSGNIDSGETFDTWRHSQCMASVGLPGITACNHIHFRPLLAHFQTLAGDDAAAFRTLMQTGKPTDHAAPGDTHEARSAIAHTIAARLHAHSQLPAGESKITVGYLVYLVRQKTRRPDLTLGQDWQAGLAERCTVTQLDQILFTLINRIAAAEGTGTPKARNKSQRAKKPKPNSDSPASPRW